MFFNLYMLGVRELLGIKFLKWSLLVRYLIFGSVKLRELLLILIRKVYI